MLCSKMLRHLHMHELSACFWQKLRFVDMVCHIAGESNIADIFTKEIKNAQYFHNMSFPITTPRLIDSCIHTTGEPISSGARGVWMGDELVRVSMGSVGKGV
jgi:hypothetical protein